MGLILSQIEHGKGIDALVGRAEHLGFALEREILTYLPQQIVDSWRRAGR